MRIEILIISLHWIGKTLGFIYVSEAQKLLEALKGNDLHHPVQAKNMNVSSYICIARPLGLHFNHYVSLVRPLGLHYNHYVSLALLSGLISSYCL